MIMNDNNIITSKRTECKMWCKKYTPTRVTILWLNIVKAMNIDR